MLTQYSTMEDGFQIQIIFAKPPASEVSFLIFELKTSTNNPYVGSSFEFSVFNTASVFVELGNTVDGPDVDKFEPDSSPSVIPVLSYPGTEGPASVFASVNGSANATYHHDIIRIVALGHKLDPNAVHTFKVTLPYHCKARTIQFKNIWIRKGGQLLHPRAKHDVVMTENNVTRKKTTMLLDKHDDLPERRLVEIMAPTTLLSYTCPSTRSAPESGSWAVNWPTLLQDNFLDTTVSALDMSSTSCLTSRCENLNVEPQQTFFRSGPPNTTLHNFLWPFSSTTSFPSALLLMLGLADVENLLVTENPGKYGLSSFIEELTDNYSELIQTIRRTAYSPSSLANMNTLSKQLPLDESHLYNSAPSTLPIFLVLPPIPSSLLIPHSTKLKSVLHHATSKVIDSLKHHIGDKKATLIDTSGWLIDSDFTACKNATDDEPGINASDFILSQSGHIKFAHHLSLHLCPYLGGKECPFEKHSEYVGNLVVPSVEDVGRKMEEKRVEKLKDLFGVA